jgi:hypothetical protein
MSPPLIALIALLLLAGCAGINDLLDRAADSGTSPVVRGSGGGQARLTLITCPRTQEGAQAIIDLINYLLQQPTLVIARSSGSAVLVINACPPRSNP